MMTHNIRPAQGLVNGTSALLHSIVFDDSDRVSGVQYQAALLNNRFQLISITTSPIVTLRVGGTSDDVHLWHGIPLEDLSDCTDSVDGLGQVIATIEQSACQANYRKLSSDVAASLCSRLGRNKFDVMKRLPYTLAFAITDYKLQGRTMRLILINIRKRHGPPHMNLVSFYVMVSRVRGFAGVRLLGRCNESCERLSKCRHKLELAAWDRGYDENGFFSAIICRAAYEKAEAEEVRRKKVASIEFTRKRRELQRKKDEGRKKRVAARSASDAEKRARIGTTIN
jgi:hypothetical protein